jgi:hypothetical protein
MKLIVRTRTGHEIAVDLDDQKVAEKSVDEACEQFFNSVEFANLSTLRLGHAIWWVREIESLRFEK